MPKGTERREKRITLRLPPSLREAIERQAELDGRSISDWIVRTLQTATGTLPTAPKRRRS